MPLLPALATKLSGADHFLLMHQHVDMRVMEALKRFRCGKCQVPGAPVYPCASHHRRFCFGPAPDWAWRASRRWR